MPTQKPQSDPDFIPAGATPDWIHTGSTVSGAKPPADPDFIPASSPYEGVSNPPEDNTYTVTSPADDRNAAQREFDKLSTPDDANTSPMLRPMAHFGAGAIQGVGQPFFHPLDTAEGIVNTALHPIVSAQGMYQSAKDDPAKTLGNLVGGADLGGIAAEAGSPILSRIPTRAKAGNLFESVMKDAQDQPVNLNTSAPTLLRVRELADRGTSMPQAANKLLRRVTDPDQGPLTYREARDFASNLSRLSSGEAQKLTPIMKRQVGQLSHDFNQDIANAASDVGREEDYSKAMHDYAIASRLRNAAITGAKIAIPTALGAAGYGLARKLMPIVLPQ